MKMRLLLGVLALGLFCGLGVVAVSMAKSQAQAADLERWGADPNNPPDLDDFALAKSQLSVPEDLTDEEIQEMVERLFVAEDWRWNHLRLNLVGRRAVPVLIAALDDPRIATTEFPLHERHSGLTSLHRVSLLLDPWGPPEAASSYTRLASDEKEWVRSRAGEALGNIGTAQCIEPVKTVLGDNEVMLRLMTVGGIAAGIDSGRAKPEFLKGVFPAVAEIPESLSNREGGFDQELAQEATVLALRIDPEQAALILGPFLIESSSESFVWRALETIDTKQVVLSRELLGPLMEKMKEKYSRSEIPDTTYMALLQSYGRNPDADAETQFRNDLNSEDYLVADTAAESLMRLKGIEDPAGYLIDLNEAEEEVELTPPQTTYLLAWKYEAEINNGGHTQFFANTPGKVCHATLTVLQEIGATKTAKILTEATLAAGLKSSDGDILIAPDEQPELVEKLETFDEQFYEADEISRLLKRYVLKHPDHFKPMAK